MAAGRSSRFGRPKPLEPLGPGGASLMVYTLFDALRAGFGRVVVVTRPPLRGRLEAYLREHLGDGLPVEWVFQEPGDVPEPHRGLLRARSADGQRPWGTGHAVLCARRHLPGAFGVANADDWYGPEALQALADSLRGTDMTAAPPPPPPRPGGSEGRPSCRAVLVGFPMAATLPPGAGAGTAGVSRGWVRARGGEVESVLELRDVARATTVEAPSPGRPGPHVAPGISGIAPDGRRVSVPEDAWASMNLWGFPACALPLLASAFEEFLAREGALPDAEFALSSAVDDLVHQGALALRLVPRGRRWCGITHPDDAPWVRDRLRSLHADGTYPEELSQDRAPGA